MKPDPQSLVDSRQLLIFGDSLSAGYGMRVDESWPTLLQTRLGPTWKVRNASVSGETTLGGLRRLPAALDTHRPALVVLELGANDAFGGLSMASAADNLTAMVKLAKSTGAAVVLIGLELPPLFDPKVLEAFHDMFKVVAATNMLPSPPSLFQGLFTEREFFQPDLIHPSAKAQPKMLDNVWPTIESALSALRV